MNFFFRRSLLLIVDGSSPMLCCVELCMSVYVVMEKQLYHARPYAPKRFVNSTISSSFHFFSVFFSFFFWLCVLVLPVSLEPLLLLFFADGRRRCHCRCLPARFVVCCRRYCRRRSAVAAAVVVDTVSCCRCPFFELYILSASVDDDYYDAVSDSDLFHIISLQQKKLTVDMRTSSLAYRRHISHHLHALTIYEFRSLPLVHCHLTALAHVSYISRYFVLYFFIFNVIHISIEFLCTKFVE